VRALLPLIALGASLTACPARGRDEDEVVGAQSLPETRKRTPRTDPGFRPLFAGNVDPGADDDKFSFSLKLPCTVPARQFTYRSKKHSRVVRLNVVFEEHNEGYQVRMQDLQLETFDGERLDNDAPELYEVAKTFVSAVSTQLPTFVVSKKGAFVETLDAAELVAKMREESSPLVSKKVLDALDDDAELMAYLETLTHSRWHDWVGRWNGRSIRPGEQQQEQEQLPGTWTEASIDVDSTVEHLGTLGDSARLRFLRSKNVATDDRVSALATDQVRELTARMGLEAPPPGVIGPIRWESTLYAVLDPASVRPHRTRRETVVEAGDHRFRRIEEWEFDWTHATGCR